jgi:hypothetical protein
LKKYLLLFFFCFSSVICFAQDDDYKTKQYDRQLIDYIISEIENKNLTFDDCLKYTKPFSKWDLQSITSPQVWIFDNYQESSLLSNILFGVITKHFNISLPDAKKMPNDFLQKAVDDFEVYEKDALDNAGTYFDLIEMLKKSQSKIFLNQDNLQRVDNMFYENGAYWKYIIPEDSPFPVSDSINNNIPETFSEEDLTMLNKMRSLGIYVVYKDKEVIYLLKDGMLDNSFGYYFKDNDIDYRKKNHLFNIMSEELLMPRFYYYIAN